MQDPIIMKLQVFFPLNVMKMSMEPNYESRAWIFLSIRCSFPKIPIISVEAFNLFPILFLTFPWWWDIGEALENILANVRVFILKCWVCPPIMVIKYSHSFKWNLKNWLNRLKSIQIVLIGSIWGIGKPIKSFQFFIKKNYKLNQSKPIFPLSIFINWKS